MRPVTPDVISLIGRTKQIENLLIVAGHAMMEVSLAPITGKIISDFVEGKPDGSYIKFLSPNRF